MAVLARHHDLLDHQQHARGEGDRDQRAEGSEQGRPGQGRDERHGAGHRHRPSHDLRRDQVVLDLLVDDVVDQHDHGRLQVDEQCDRDHDHRPEGGADQGDQPHDADRDRQDRRVGDTQHEHHHVRAQAVEPGDGELADHVTADAAADLVAQKLNPVAARGRHQRVPGGPDRPHRCEEVQRQDEDGEGAEHAVEHGLSGSQDAAEDGAEGLAVAQPVLQLGGGTAHKVVSLVELDEPAAVLQLLEVVGHLGREIGGLLDEDRDNGCTEPGEHRDDPEEHQGDRPATRNAVPDQPSDQGLEAEGEEQRHHQQRDHLGELAEHRHQAVGDEDAECPDEADVEGMLAVELRAGLAEPRRHHAARAAGVGLRLVVEQAVGQRQHSAVVGSLPDEPFRVGGQGLGVDRLDAWGDDLVEGREGAAVAFRPSDRPALRQRLTHFATPLRRCQRGAQPVGPAGSLVVLVVVAHRIPFVDLRRA